MRLNGHPLWLASYTTFLNHEEVASVGIVCQQGREEEYRKLAPDALFVVAGGQTRQESAELGARQAEGFDAVLLHDAARPFVTNQLISAVIDALATYDGAAPGITVTDTVRERIGGEYRLLDRNHLSAMQTPQGARRSALLEAYGKAQAEFTDDLAILDAAGKSTTIVPGDPKNVKVTYESDLPSLRETRTGLGYDIHRFSSDPHRPLWLGGVQFEGAPGLEGHSDADVLLHAIMDALLGGAALGDIGVHFSNTDPRWADISSIILLEAVLALLRTDNWSIVNIDATVIAEQPKVMVRAEAIREAIAKTLGINKDQVSIKATTNEMMGAVGRSEGIAAMATATLIR